MQTTDSRHFSGLITLLNPEKHFLFSIALQKASFRKFSVSLG